jgi:hypothetical protein
MAHEIDLKALWKDLDEYSLELEREQKTLHDVWLKIAQIKAKNETELKEQVYFSIKIKISLYLFYYIGS